jgi:hypothetical protein
MGNQTPHPGSRRAVGGSSKEYRKFLGAIRAAGGELRECTGRAGHYKVYLDGALIGTVAGTPSDPRGRQNDIAQLRRAGLRIDSKGRPLP